LSLLSQAVGLVGRRKKLMLISTQVENLVEVWVELYVAVVEAGADLQYTFPDGLLTTDYDGLTGRSDNNAISALRYSFSWS